MAAGGPCDDATTAVGVCDDLSILCVTKAEECTRGLLYSLVYDAHLLGAEPFIVADGMEALNRLRAWDEERWAEGDNEHDYVRYKVESRGYIESVLDEAIANANRRPYILRIDDDESISLPMLQWLRSGSYRSALNWKFPRAHLIDTEDQFIASPPLWRDHQTRLSVRAMSGGRSHIHAGSPHGGGELAPVPLLHAKFLVKSYEQRKEIVERYERLQAGAGKHFWQFSVPENNESVWVVRPLEEAYAQAASDAESTAR